MAGDNLHVHDILVWVSIVYCCSHLFCGKLKYKNCTILFIVGTPSIIRLLYLKLQTVSNHAKTAYCYGFQYDLTFWVSLNFANLHNML